MARSINWFTLKDSKEIAINGFRSAEITTEAIQNGTDIVENVENPFKEV